MNLLKDWLQINQQQVFLEKRQALNYISTGMDTYTHQMNEKLGH